MRSITFVQAFQYWLKLTALAVPVVFLLLAWRADGARRPAGAGPPVTREATQRHGAGEHPWSSRSSSRPGVFAARHAWTAGRWPARSA